MRTARLLTVSCVCVWGGGGGCLLRGKVCLLRRREVCHTMVLLECRTPPPLVDKMTHIYENITFSASLCGRKMVKTDTGLKTSRVIIFVAPVTNFLTSFDTSLILIRYCAVPFRSIFRSSGIEQEHQRDPVRRGPV